MKHALCKKRLRLLTNIQSREKWCYYLVVLPVSACEVGLKRKGHSSKPRLESRAHNKKLDITSFLDKEKF